MPLNVWHRFRQGMRKGYGDAGGRKRSLEHAQPDSSPNLQRVRAAVQQECEQVRLPDCHRAASILLRRLRKGCFSKCHLCMQSNSAPNWLPRVAWPGSAR